MKVYESQLRWRRTNGERLRFLRRRWNKQNRDKVNAYRRAYRKRNPEKFKAYLRKWAEKNGKKTRVYRSKPETRYARYQANAKDRGYSFHLTLEQFCSLVVSACHYCGFKETNVGIDRKDNSQGYTTGNSLPCCKDCNWMKGDMEYEAFLAACKKITEVRN